MTADLGLTADQVLTTTRSVRKRLDFDRPVSREVLLECLDLALQAPTGSNKQGWQWVFVEDDAKKQAIADVYRETALPYLESTDGDTSRGPQMNRVLSSSRYLTENLQRAPVLLVPCLRGRTEGMSAGEAAGFWGSLLPAVWSYMLALRARGLGTAWTTLHLYGEGERKVADLLGIPFEEYTQGGLFPIAYTKGTDFKRADRVPAEQLVHFDSW